MAISVQMENSRMEKHAREGQSAIQSEIVQNEQDLRRLISKAITNGTNSIQLVLSQLREQNKSGKHNKLIDGYHGE